MRLGFKSPQPLRGKKSRIVAFENTVIKLVFLLNYSFRAATAAARINIQRSQNLGNLGHIMV